MAEDHGAPEAGELARAWAKDRRETEQPPQRDGAIPNPVWVRSKWLLAFPRVPVIPGTPFGNLLQ